MLTHSHPAVIRGHDPKGAAQCLAGTKSNHLTFSRAGVSCGSHRHHQDHWTHFRSGGPFWVRIYHHGFNGKRGEIKEVKGPFGPGSKCFIDKDLHHEVISDGPGEADCVFEDDGSPNVARERTE